MSLGGGAFAIHDGKNNKALAKESKLAIENTPTFENFASYPVPLNNDGLWLEIPQMEKEGDFKVSIYNMHGRKLAEKQFRSGEEGSKQLWNLKHQEWSYGMYLLIVQGEGMLNQQKLIK